MLKRIDQSKVIDKLCDQVEKDIGEFAKIRLCNQLKWYSRHASRNRYWFYALTLLTFVLPGLVTFINIALASGDNYVITGNLIEDLRTFRPVISSLLSLITSTCAFCLGLFRFREHWTNYREPLEKILGLGDLYCAGALPYHESDRAIKFIENVELIIKDEIDQWANNQQPNGTSPL